MISFNLVALRDHIVENEAKLAGGKATDKTLYALGWTIDELSRLTDECRALLVELESLVEKLEDESTDIVRINIPRTLSRCQERLRIFTKSVTRHKRMPASHILVTMISPSERNQKPYALPISCIPYASLSEGKARAVISEIVKEMCKRGMKVAGMCTTNISCLFLFTSTVCTLLGFVSNGEYNTF